MRSRTSRIAVSLLFVAVAALLAGSASISHTHVSSTPGLFNEEHDLTYLATLGAGSGVVPDAPSSAPFAVVESWITVHAPASPPAAATRDQDSRAPPLAHS
jgi:hypothetical protein